MVPYITTDQRLLSFPEEIWFERGPGGWGCPPSKATCLLSSVFSGHIQLHFRVVPDMTSPLLLQRAVLPSLPGALSPGHTKARRDSPGCDQSSSRISQQDSRPGCCCCCLCPDESCASSPPASSKPWDCEALLTPFRALLSLHWCFSSVIFLFLSEVLQDCLAPLHKFSSPWLCHWGETRVWYPMASLGKGLLDPGWSERGFWAMRRMREGCGLHPQDFQPEPFILFVISMEIFFSCYYGDCDAFFDCNFYSEFNKTMWPFTAARGLSSSAAW